VVCFHVCGYRRRSNITFLLISLFTQSTHVFREAGFFRTRNFRVFFACAIERERDTEFASVEERRAVGINSIYSFIYFGRVTTFLGREKEETGKAG